jgi:hypothetical protein
MDLLVRHRSGLNPSSSSAIDPMPTHHPLIDDERRLAAPDRC